MNLDRKATEEEFARMRNLPGVKESLKLKVSNGDAKMFDPRKMPSLKRIDQINRASKAVFAKKK